MIKIPIINTINTRKKYANKRSTIKKVPSKKETNNKKSHSFIFNYSGLNNALLKYNSNKDNKNTAEEKSYLTEEQNKVQKKSMEYSDKNSSLTKLKEMNCDMDLILTGIKTNLEGSTVNTDKKIINADRFINQINNKNNKSNNLVFNNKRNEPSNKSYENLKYSFSYMKICNFNFEIINKKKHFININEIKEKNKIEFIFDNKREDNQIDVDNMIDLLYDYKNKVEEMKLSNKSLITKHFINDSGINKEIEKYLEINKINENNRIIKNEIDFLTEKLTYSFYKSELLLNKYYNKLKEFDINVEKDIKEISNEYKNNIILDNV